MTFQDLKDRFIKYDSLHGLYKIPFGLLLLYLVFSNLTRSIVFSADIFQLRYILHMIAAAAGMRYLMEGLYNLLHNPIKKAAMVELRKNDLIARSDIATVPATQPAAGQVNASISSK